MIVSRCHNEAVDVCDSPEGAYYVCSHCHSPAEVKTIVCMADSLDNGEEMQ